MTASGMFVSDAPPLIAISVSKQSMTHRLIAKAREFAVILHPLTSKYRWKLGGTHGETVDKLKKFKISTEPAQRSSHRL